MSAPDETCMFISKWSASSVLQVRAALSAQQVSPVTSSRYIMLLRGCMASLHPCLTGAGISGPHQTCRCMGVWSASTVRPSLAAVSPEAYFARPPLDRLLGSYVGMDVWQQPADFGHDNGVEQCY